MNCMFHLLSYVLQFSWQEPQTTEHKRLMMYIFILAKSRSKDMLSLDKESLYMTNPFDLKTCEQDACLSSW